MTREWKIRIPRFRLHEDTGRMERLDVDWEYFGPKDIFAGKLWMGIGKNNAACFAKTDFASGKIIDLAACKRDTESGFVCDLDRQKHIATDFVRSLYADGYTLVICVDCDGKVKGGDRKAENGEQERDSVSDRMGSAYAALGNS